MLSYHISNIGFMIKSFKDQLKYNHQRKSQGKLTEKRIIIF